MSNHSKDIASLVKTYHPDRHMAAGTPPEFLRVAEARMAAINAAYAEVARRGAVPDEAVGAA